MLVLTNPLRRCLQTERQAYKSAPKTFLQQWLRRNPPAHELPVLMRAAHADGGEPAWLEGYQQSGCTALTFACLCGRSVFVQQAVCQLMRA